MPNIKEQILIVHSMVNMHVQYYTCGEGVGTGNE
jgi:hypothetical protein